MGGKVKMNTNGEKHLKIQMKSGAELDATLLRVREDEVACALLVHGITVDKDEGGMYSRLASDLERAGISTLRFSFSGHGESSGSDIEVNLFDQIEELRGVILTSGSIFDTRPLFIIASSFGAVPTLMMDKELCKKITGLVLWNPVISVEHTFFEPELTWGVENFGLDRISKLAAGDFISVDGFRLSKKFFESLNAIRMKRLSPSDEVKTLVIHGAQDSYVSFHIAKKMCNASGSCEFSEIPNSDHGFDEEENELMARSLTVEWIKKKCKTQLK